jgi:hypothetical protein
MSVLNKFLTSMASVDNRKIKAEREELDKIIRKNMQHFNQCMQQINHVQSASTEQTTYIYVLGHSSEKTLTSVCTLPPNTVAIEGQCLTSQSVSRSWEIRHATEIYKNVSDLAKFVNSCFSPDANAFANNVNIKHSLKMRTSTLLLDFKRENSTIVLNSGIQLNNMPLYPDFISLKKLIRKRDNYVDYVITENDVSLIYRGSLYPTVEQAIGIWRGLDIHGDGRSFNHFKHELNKFVVNISSIILMLHKAMFTKFENVCWVLATCRVGDIDAQYISRGSAILDYCLINEDDPRCLDSKRDSDESKKKTPDALRPYGCIWFLVDNIWHGIQIDGNNYYISKENPKDSSEIKQMNPLVHILDNCFIILYNSKVYKYDYQKFNIELINPWRDADGYQFININNQYFIRKNRSSPALYAIPIINDNQQITHIRVTDLNNEIDIESTRDANADYVNAVNQFTNVKLEADANEVYDNEGKKKRIRDDNASGIKSKKKRNKKRKSKNTKKKS